MGRWLILVSLLAGASACYRPDLNACAVSCADGVCPGDLHCLGDGFCHASLTDDMCPVVDFDAGTIDAEDQPTPRMLALSAGAEHVCAVDADGQLLCWGGNYWGQIGNASGSPEPFPLPVLISDGWTTVDAGGNFNCGIREGALLCWGSGGNREPTAIIEPEDPPDRWVQVSVSPGHACAIGEVGTERKLWCMGDDFEGQLGDGAPTGGGAQPRLVAPPAGGTEIVDWQQVSAGTDHTCALRAGGEAYCWGNGSSLGDGTMLDRDVPTPVLAADDDNDQYARITAGWGYTHAIGATTGRRYQWGGKVLSPVRVGTREDWSDVVVGTDATCGTTTAGPRCWGFGHVGQMGTGDFEGSTAVDGVAVDDLAGAGLITAGGQFACFSPDAGGVRCWGANHYGTIGDGSVASKATPTLIDDTGVWTDVSAGVTHTCGIRDDAVHCWGRNEQGQLGLTSGIPWIATPQTVDVSGLAGIDVAVGDGHACAALTNGVQPQLWCWGANDYGEVGTGTPGVFPPTAISTAGSWEDVSAASQSSSARAGIFRNAWGANDGGRLGNGDTLMVPAPVAADATAWAVVDQGSTFGCGINNSQLLQCWGSDADGEQGTGGGGDRTSPGPVDAPNTYYDVSASSFGDFVCAIRLSPRQLFCWGRNLYGEAGLAGGADVLSPNRVGSTSNWSQVSAGVIHACGVDGGVLRCWGATGSFMYSPVNQLGSHLPSTVDDTRTWEMVSVSNGHSCAITTDGALYCWGLNIFGELGDGTMAAPAPVTVMFPGE